MIDKVARLELLVVDAPICADSEKAAEDSRIDRAVNQTARGVTHLVVDDERVWLGRECSALRKLHYHAHAPRVAAQKPVAQSPLHLLIGRVTGQFTVKDALGQHRRGQVVGTPYSRNAEEERMILPPLIDPLDSGADVPDELRRDLAPEVPRYAVMPHVHERIPLVVARAVGPHPRGHRLAAGIFNGISPVLRLTRAAEHLVGRQLHVIHPVVLLVDVRGDHRGGLADTWFRDSRIVGGLRLRSDLLRKLGVERPYDLRPESEVGGELPGCAGDSRGLVPVSAFPSPLRLAGAEPDRTVLPFPPAVVCLIIVRDSHPDVVAVIRDLVVHLPRLRIHLVQPLEAPINLIDDVRNPVPAGSAVRQAIVGEGLRIALVGEHHLVNRIG